MAHKTHRKTVLKRARVLRRIMAMMEKAEREYYLRMKTYLSTPLFTSEPHAPRR